MNIRRFLILILICGVFSACFSIDYRKSIVVDLTVSQAGSSDEHSNTSENDVTHNHSDKEFNKINKVNSSFISKLGPSVIQNANDMTSFDAQYIEVKPLKFGGGIAHLNGAFRHVTLAVMDSGRVVTQEYNRPIIVNENYDVEQ